MGDCPGVWCFQKAAPGSRFPRRGERAGSGLAPEPCCLARNRHACPGSRRSLPSPQFFVANADGSPRRLFFFFFYLFFSFFFPRPPVSSLSLWLEGGVCSCARPTGTASEERGKKKEVSLLKKKKKKSLMEALFYQRYQNLNCTRASVRPSPPSSAPSLRRVSGFQSESCCVCSAPAPLFLVLKRERIPFLNQRPDAQGWEDLGGEGGGE